MKAFILAFTPFISIILPLSAESTDFLVRGDGISFHGSHPGIVLSDTRTGAATELMPQGVPKEESGHRKTPAGPATVRTLRWSDPRGFDCSWTITRLDQHAGATVQMTFTNTGRQPVRLREFTLMQCGPDGFTAGGNPTDWFLSTLDSHDSTIGGFNRSTSLDATGKRRFLDILTLYSQLGRKGMLMGAVGPAVSDVRFHCDLTGTGGMKLKVVSEMNDVLVDPGETRCSEEVLVLAEPFDEATPRMMRWLAATHGSRTARGPLAGWCSWYGRGPNIDAKFIGGICETVKAGRDRLPLQVIQIDDGWQKAYGDWEADPAKFPHGMKAVAEQIRAAGAIPGIWLCPNRSSPKGAHPDGLDTEFLDVSHPEVRKFIRKSLTDRVAEGFRYFKLDFLWIRGETLAKRFDQKKTRLQLARDVCQLYREAIGEDSYLLSCVGGYNRGTYGYADAARIGTDTSAAFKKLYDGVCMADCLNATGSTAWSNGILFANDPDVTYLHMGDSEVKRTWLGYVGLLGGLALTSEPLSGLDAAAIRNFEILIPPAPDKGRAFDGQTDPWHRRFGFVAQRPWGNFASILLWNPEDEPADVSLAGVPLESLGSKFHAWSFWDEKYLGLVDADWVARELPTHGSRVLRFTAADEKRPVLIGSTLHIGMGSAEVKRCEASTAGIGIELTDAGARDGSLFIFHRGTLALASAEGCEASLSAAGENVWRLSITGRQRGTPNFVKIDHKP